MLALYRFIIGFLFWISLPLLLTIVLLTGWHRRGLSERLAFYESPAAELGNGTRIWVHAASIGEVRAAGMLIDSLKVHQPPYNFLVTTMTVHGRDFARQHLGPEVACQLAPLDVPFSVNRSLALLAPDLYVCLETELWPLLIDTLRKKQVPTLLINGRLSDRSITTYRRLRFLFSPVLQSFQLIGAISDADRQRFIEVGADPDRVVVTGNIKDDIRLPQDPEKIAANWSELLDLKPEVDVFIAGSTHNPEEELLFPLISDLIERGTVVILAPRHLDRLAVLESQIKGEGMHYDRLSRLKQGLQRTQPLVLVDTFGDLGELYSIATFVFVGGSLSGSGGHNAMEPAVWAKVVFFGPDMADFSEAAATLENRGGGFKVNDVAELGNEISMLQEDRNRLQQIQQLAGAAAREQLGAAEQQADLINKSLNNSNKVQT